MAIKKGSTGKSYEKDKDKIKVTYSDGSTRTVWKSDASYATTKKAMEADTKSYKKTKTAGTSKVNANNALGEGVTAGRGIVANAQVSQKAAAAKTAKANSTYEKEKKAKQQGYKAKNNSALEQAKQLNSQVRNVQAQQTNEFAKGITPRSLKAGTVLAGQQIKSGTKAGLISGSAEVGRGGNVEGNNFAATADIIRKAMGNKNSNLYANQNNINKNIDTWYGVNQRIHSLKDAKEKQAIAEKMNMNDFTPAENLVSNLTASTGAMAPMVGLSAINPALGLGYMTNLSRGSGELQALQTNPFATNAQVQTGGLGNAASEIGVEVLTGGLAHVPGLVNVGKLASGAIKNPTAKSIARAAGDIAGEAFEEGLNEFINPYIERATYNPNAENASAGDVAYAALLGALSTGAINGTLNLAGRAASAAQNRNNPPITVQQLIENAQKQQQNNPNQQNIQQNQGESSQNAQNQPQQENANTATNPISNAQNVAQNQSSEADFQQNPQNFQPQQNAPQNVQNQPENVQVRQENVQNPADNVRTAEQNVQSTGVNVIPREQLAPDQQKFINTIESRSGLKIVIVDELANPAADGQYHNGVVTMKASSLNSAKGRIKLASHEVFHSFRGTEQWNEIIDWAVDYYAAKEGLDRNSMLQGMAAKYSNADSERASLYDLSTEEGRTNVYDEIGAAFVEELVSDERVAQRLWEQKPNLAQRILDKIREILGRIGMDENQKAAADALRKAEKSFARGMDAVQRNGVSVSEEGHYAVSKKLEADFAKWMEGDFKNDYFEIGETPEVLIEFGAKQLPITMTQEVAVKATGGKHGVSITELSQIPSRIANPVMLFNGSVPGSFVVLTEGKDNFGDDIIIAIHLNKLQNRLRVNKVASIYGKNNIENYINSNMTEEKFLDADTKKAPEWFTSRGLQLPKLVQTNIDAKLRVTKEDTSVNTENQLNSNNIPPGLNSFGAENSNEWLDNAKAIQSNTLTTGRDTTGKELTPKQREYFKDSKIRDENGNLLVLYHGTKADFTVFNQREFGGGNGIAEGYGIYLTDKKDISDAYGENVLKGYANITNPAYSDRKTLKQAAVAKLIKATCEKEAERMVADGDYDSVKDALKDTWVSNYEYTYDKPMDTIYRSVAKSIIDMEDGDMGIIQEIMSGIGVRGYKQAYDFYDTLKGTLGIDGFVTEWDDSQRKAKIVLAFDSNQFKNADNANPTTDSDIRYSIDDGSDWTNDARTFQGMTDEYGTMPKGENPFGNNRDIDVPASTDGQDRTRQFIRTGMEAEQVADETVSELQGRMTSDYYDGKMSYTPISNAETVQMANDELNTALKNNLDAGMSPDQARQKVLDDGYSEFHGKVIGNELPSATEVAKAERLIQIAQDAGDYQRAADIIIDMSVVGTQIGQAMQAYSMLKRLSPQGQLMALQRSIDRMNHMQTQKGAEKIALPEGFAQEYLQARSNAKREELADKAFKEAANKLEGSWADKINAYRYSCMLCNPATHLRNLLSNGVMGLAGKVGDGASGLMQDAIIGKGEKTRSFKKGRKYTPEERAELHQLVEDMWNDSGKKVLGEGGSKYDNTTSAIEQNKRIFKNDILENTIGNGRFSVSSALEAEDMIFKQIHYKDTLMDYIQANGFTPQEIKQAIADGRNIEKPNGASLYRGVAYAENMARKRTFTEDNKVSNWLNEGAKLKAGNLPVGEVLLGGIIPYRRTPLNIMVRGIEYSPAGLAMTLHKAMHVDSNATFDASNKNGTYTVAEVLDSLGANLSGTAIFILGVYMQANGLLNGSGDDDKKKQNFDRATGRQEFSVNTPGGGTATIDWLSPAAMPLLAGAATFESLTAEEKNMDAGTLSRVLENLARISDPAFEMSCMQGVTEALSSYNSGVSGATSALWSGVSSYGGQFVPNVVKKVAYAIDDTKRSTYSPKNSPLTKSGAKFEKGIRGGLPLVSKTLQPKIDMWGNDEQRDIENKGWRLISGLVNPTNYKSNRKGKVENELERLYNEVGESKVFPSSTQGYVQYRNENLYMNEEEYTKYARTKGKNSYKYVAEFMQTPEYNEMPDTEKVTVIEKLYNVANYQARKEFVTGYDGAEFVPDTQYENPLTYKGGVVKYCMAKTGAFAGSDYSVDKIDEIKALASEAGLSNETYMDIRSNITGKDDEGNNLSKDYKKAYLTEQRNNGTLTGKQYWTIYLNNVTPSAADITQCGNELGRDSELFQKYKAEYNAKHKKQVR